MTGNLVLIFRLLIVVCLSFGIAVTLHRVVFGRAFAILALAIFAITYVWSELFGIWINRVSFLRTASYVHAFYPAEIPSHFLVRALLWSLPSMILAGVANARTHRRKKEVLV